MRHLYDGYQPACAGLLLAQTRTVGPGVTRRGLIRGAPIMLSISRPMWVTKGRAVLLAGVLLATGLGTTACTENTGKGAAIGAAAGAGLGVLNGGIIRSA